MGLFFYNHVLPKNFIEADKFLKDLKERGKEGLDTLKKEFSNFTPTELSIFLERVLPRTNDEDVLAIVYQTAPTIQIMGIQLVTAHFAELYKKANDGLISQDFFEESAACLIKYYDSSRGLNLLANFSINIKPSENGSHPANTLITEKIDLAMAGHLKKVLPLLFDNNIFCRACDTLRRVELPESVRVLVRHRLENNDHESAIRLTGELFHSNRLSDRYIEVLREELGDEMFLQGCTPYAGGSDGLNSIAKLTPIFGEATFHTEEFLKGVYWPKKDVRTPHHIQKFHELGFDEKLFPILAEHVGKNLKLAMRFNPKVIKNFSLMPNTARLAKRLGMGNQALEAYIDGQRERSGVDRSASYAEILAGLDININNPNYTMGHSMAKAVLFDVIDAVGVKALRDIVPDIGGDLVSQYLAAKGPEMNRREVFRLFPQAKASVLEADLGM